MSPSLRWGILGTGKIARIMAGALTRSRTAELVAVASRSSDRARSFASELPATRWYGDYESLIEDSEVALVYVATHHPEHRMCAIAAADAGKHVLCEKPLAVHHQDALAMVESARRNVVFLMEAFAYRCHAQTSALVELLRSGSIGEVRMVDAVFGYDAGPTPSNYLLTRGLAGGSILDVGCYTTSAAHLIARVGIGGDVADTIDVCASARIGWSDSVDHYAAAVLSFDGGLLARVACAVRVDLDSSLRIYGTEGRITVASPWLPGIERDSSRIIITRRGRAPEEVLIAPGADLYATEAAAVSSFIGEAEMNPSVMPWEESLANMRTLDRWRDAIHLSYEDDIAPSSASVVRGSAEA